MSMTHHFAVPLSIRRSGDAFSRKLKAGRFDRHEGGKKAIWTHDRSFDVALFSYHDELNSTLTLPFLSPDLTLSRAIGAGPDLLHLWVTDTSA